MAVLYANNARSTLAASITASQTSLTVATGHGALFPTPTGSDVFYATLTDINESIREIVRVTARATDTLTVVRGQDGTSAQSWAADTKVELRLTKAMLDDFKADARSGLLSGNQTVTLSGDVSGSGTTSITTTLANSGVIAGTYPKVTVDAKGRVTSGSSLASGDLPTYGGTLTSSQVTTALGYTPYNNTNPSGYISGINAANVTAALGFTPYNSTNPSGYVTSSGSGASGTWGINITGSAASAGSVSGLTLNNSANGINPDSVTQNQIGYNTSVSLYGQADGGLYSSAYSGSWIHQIFGDFRSGQIAVRGKNNGTWQAWRAVLDASNYTSYSPSLTGSGASGTWGINVTGSAGTLQGYQWNSSGKDIRGSDIYADSWLRNYNSGTGLYNQATANHWYSDGAYWNVGYSGTTGIRLRNGHAGAVLGYLYGETNGNFGLLHNGGGWAVQVNPGGGGNLHGTWTVGGSTPLTAGNYSSYAPSLTGGGASGTWGINITGNAATISSQANSATITASSGVNASHIVQRDGNGYIYANHVNFNTGVENPSIANVITDNGDGWSRKSSLAHVKNSIRGIADGTWGININGTFDASNRCYSREWIEFPNFSGLYSPQNGAHFYPNNSSYGSWRIAGSRNGWHGIYFDSGSTLMMNSNEVGFYRIDHGWQFWWSAGTGYVHKGNPGGGTQATILDSSNYTSYAPSKTGSGASGTWGINVSGNASSVSIISSAQVIAALGYTPYNAVNVVLHAGNYSSYALPLSGGTVTGATYFRTNVGSTTYLGSVSNASLQAYTTDNGPAYMSFHRAGVYAVNMGLDPDNVMRIGGWSANANRWQLDMSGNGTYAGNVTAYSDERLKKDWTPIDSGFVQQLATLRAGTYTRTDSGERQAGVSAQAMREILPEVVTEDHAGMLALAYGNAALVSAVELAKDNVELRARVERLEAIVATLLGDRQ